MPTVEEKKPGEQYSFKQGIFLTQSKRFRISRLVLDFIFPTISETEYSRDITITRCK